MKIMKGLMVVAAGSMLLSGCTSGGMSGLNEYLTPDTQDRCRIGAVAGGILGGSS